MTLLGHGTSIFIYRRRRRAVIDFRPGRPFTIRTGELPAIQVGARGLWRIEVAALEDYIDKQYAHTREAVSEGGLDL